MRERAGYLPKGFALSNEIAWIPLRFENRGEACEIEVPALTPDQLTSLGDFVKERRRRAVAALSVPEIVDAIDRSVHRLLDREQGHRPLAERLLPVITGYDPETIRLGLTKTLKSFRKPQLLRFLAQDFANPAILDAFVPQPGGGFAKAYGPELTTHVWAGNVPALPAWSLVSALLVKSPSIGKVSSSEPFFAGWFASALAEESQELAEAMAVVWWKGGDEASERAAFAASEAVVAYGGLKTVRNIRDRVAPEVRYLAFGHKISAGFIAREALNVHQAPLLGARAALDVVRYDQQGCYSPQQFFVERGARVQPKEFARMLAHELDNLASTRPMRSLSLHESAAAARYRETALFGSDGCAASEVWTGKNGTWTVVYDERIELMPSSLNRSVRVTAVDELDEAVQALRPYRAHLQTCGIAASPEYAFELAAALGEVGVTRICAIGEMTSPEPGWHHDGRFSLLDLVRMVDIERSVESHAEDVADYRE